MSDLLVKQHTPHGLTSDTYSEEVKILILVLRARGNNSGALGSLQESESKIESKEF